MISQYLKFLLASRLKNKRGCISKRLGIYSVIFWCGHNQTLFSARLYYWPTFHLPVKKKLQKMLAKGWKNVHKRFQYLSNIWKQKFWNTSKNNNQHSKKMLPTAWEKYCQTCAKNMLSSVGKKNVAKRSKTNFLTNAWIKVTYNLKIYDESSKKTWFSVWDK